MMMGGGEGEVVEEGGVRVKRGSWGVGERVMGCWAGLQGEECVLDGEEGEARRGARVGDCDGWVASRAGSTSSSAC